MIFGTDKKISDLKLLDIPSIIVENTVVPFRDSARNLGVILSDDLTWNDHVSKITSNINSILCSLYKNQSSIPIQVRITLIKHLVFPHFDYACTVYNSLSEYLNQKLQKLQNRCVRFIFNLRKDSSITPFRKRLSWLTVRFRRKYFLGLSVYKILKAQRPIYLYSTFKDYFSIPVRTLRPSTTHVFDPPLAKMKAFESSYHIQAMTFWNGLPKEIRDSESENIFKNKLFCFLFSQDF